jgi:CO/xanthine dehydrogenase Mo-binding subunit
MTNYIIPTAADIPPIRVYFEENPYAFGPGGAKGIGELPMDGAAPAILAAIENATGVSFNPRAADARKRCLTESLHANCRSG